MNNHSISFLLKSKKLTDTQVLHGILLLNNQDYEEFFDEYDAFCEKMGNSSRRMSELSGKFGSNTNSISSTISSSISSNLKAKSSTRARKGKDNDLLAVLDSPHFLNIPIIQTSMAYPSEILANMIKNSETLSSPASSNAGPKSFLSGIFQGGKNSQLGAVDQKTDDTSVLKWIQLLGASLRREKKDISTIFPILAPKKYFFLEETRIVVLETIATYLFENKNVSKHDFVSILSFLKNTSAQERVAKIRRLTGKIFFYLFSNTDEKLAKIDYWLQLCLRMMNDDDTETRTMFSLACGEMCYCAMTRNTSDISSPEDADQEEIKGKRKNILTFQNILTIFFNAFMKSSVTRFRESISIAIIRFLTKCPENIIVSGFNTLWSQIGSMLQSPKTVAKEKEQLEFQYYVGSIIRMGITQRLSENGQQLSLIEITKLLQNQTMKEFAIVCLLKELALLCKYLGEKVGQFRQNILDAVLASLRNRSLKVRISASLCIRALAEGISDQCSSLVSALLNMVQMTIAEMAADSYQNQEQYASSLHGHSHALAAVISVSSSNPLSISYDLCSATLDTATLLFATHKNMSENVKTMRKRSCWMLISSLMMLNDFWIENHFEKVIDLWQVELGGTYPNPEKEEDLVNMILRRASALDSLLHFMKNCGPSNTSKHLQQIILYLQSSIKVLSTLPVQISDSAPLQAAISTLKLVLYQIFIVIPSSTLFSQENRSILKFITKVAFSDADGTNLLKQSSIISTILETNTTPLTVNYSQKNMLHEIPFCFQMYGSSLNFPVELNTSCVLRSCDNFFFKRSQSLAVQVTDSATELIGNIFMYHKSTSRDQMIDHLQSRIEILKENPDDTLLSSVVYSNVIAILYTILKNVSHQSKNEENRNYISSILSILFSALICKHRNIRVAAATCFEYAAILMGSSIVDEFIVRCSELIVQASSGEQINLSGYALALGHMYKSLSTVASVDTASIVSYLLSMTKTSCKETTRGALHSLSIIIESAGMSFEEHLRSTLQALRMTLFSKQSNLPLQATLLACAEIFHSLLIIGPELSSNEQFVELFLQVFPLLYSPRNHPILLGQFIKLLQRIALLAPNLIPIQKSVLGLHTHIYYQETSVERKVLLASIIECLTVISQIKSEYLDPEIFDLETQFQLIDRYHDEVCEDVKIFVKNLIQNGQYRISHWLKVIGRITKLSDAISYRWQTQLFALECLESLIIQLKNDEEEINFQKAIQKKESNSSFDALIFHLSEIIVLCSHQVSVGNIALQKKGIELLCLILKTFEHARDASDELLLQPSSIHFATAISSGFSDNAVPRLVLVASKLMALYVSSSILSRDDSTLKRLLNLLISKSSKLDCMTLSSYGETATTLVKVTILGTVAKIFNKAQAMNNETVLSLLKPNFSNYPPLWEKAVQDFIQLSISIESDESEALVCILPQNLIPKHFYTEGVECTVLQYYALSFPDIINALTRIPTETHPLDLTLILGICIRELYRCTKQQNVKVGRTIATANDDHIHLCIDSLIQIMLRDDFFSSALASTYIPEIVHLLIRLQDIHRITLQYQCLQLLKHIIKVVSPSILEHCEMSEQQFVAQATELCIKPLRMYLPALYDPNSSSILTSEAIYHLSEEQKLLVKKSMSCLRTLMKRFPLNENVGLVTSSLCLLIEFSGFSWCKGVANIFYTCQVPTDSKNVELWKKTLNFIIEHILNRIYTRVLRFSAEIYLLFSCVGSLIRVLDEVEKFHLCSMVHTVITKTIFLKSSEEIFNFKQAVLIVQGIQEIIVYLALSEQTDYLLTYLTPYISSIVKILLLISKSEISFEDEEDSIRILIPSCLNILLVLHRVLTENYRNVKVYLLANILAILTQLFSIAPKCDTSVSSLIRKFYLDCMQKFIQNSPQETKLLMNQLNPKIMEVFSSAVKSESSLPSKASPSWNLKSNTSMFTSTQ